MKRELFPILMLYEFTFDLVNEFFFKIFVLHHLVSELRIVWARREIIYKKFLWEDIEFRE